MILVDSRPESSGLMPAGVQTGVACPERSANTRLDGVQWGGLSLVEG